MQLIRYISLFIVLLVSQRVVAQYTSYGTIEYERKINMHAQWEGNEWMERHKSEMPKFLSTYFALAFNPQQGTYKMSREPENRPFWNVPANDNLVWTDYKNKKVRSGKEIVGDKFLVTDSVPQLRWKITGEIRNIAGYQCRKAVSKILDSVYVVAFYTDDIPVSGGPEMMGGLPGMILELAIPRLHTTWVAIKVDINPPVEKDFKVPEKGKQVTQQQLYEKLQSGMKDWGKMAQRYIWWSML